MDKFRTGLLVGIPQRTCHWEGICEFLAMDIFLI